MAKQEVQLTFTFVNPNTPKEFERQLQKILIDKLLSQYWDSRVAVSWPTYIRKGESSHSPFLLLML